MLSCQVSPARLFHYLLIVLLGVMFLSQSSHSNNIISRGNRIYYIHPAYGLFILNPSLLVESLVSLPYGAPNEVDANIKSGNAFVACDGGAIFLSQGSINPVWYPDKISMGSWMGSPMQIEQGYDQVVASQSGGYVYFSHSYDSSGATGMNGYVVRMPASGGPLENLTPDGEPYSIRAYQGLLADDELDRVISVQYGGLFTMFNATTGAVMETSSSGLTPLLGDLVNCYIEKEADGDRFAGGAFLYPARPNLPIECSVLNLINYTETALLGTAGFYSYFTNSRPLYSYHGRHWHGVFDCVEVENKTGVVTYKEYEGTHEFFDTGTKGYGLPHGLTPSGNEMLVSCRQGALIINAPDGGVPSLKTDMATQGQGEFAEISNGHGVAGSESPGFALNGNAPVYLIEAINGSLQKIDLSSYAMRLNSCAPPLAGYEGNTTVTLTGVNFTPDCKAYIDIDYVARDMEDGVANDSSLYLSMKDVQYGGVGTLLAKAIPAGLGPFDIVVTNNNGRQWTNLRNAVTLTRPDLNIKSGDFFILDRDADPFDLIPAEDEDGDDLEQPGAIFHYSPTTKKTSIVTLGKNFRDVMDMAFHPVDKGAYLAIDGYFGSGISQLEGGDAGIFTLDPVKGYFNVPANLLSASPEYDIAQQVLFMPDGRLFYLDSGYIPEKHNKDTKYAHGAVFEVQPNGASILFASSPYWEQPSTIDLGPDGMVYIAEEGDFLLSEAKRKLAGGIHRMNPDTGYTELLFRNKYLGYPLDGAFSPDGDLYLVTLFGNFVKDVAYDVHRDGWIDGRDMNECLSKRIDFNSDGFFNGLDLCDLSKEWQGRGAMGMGIVKVDLDAPPNDAVTMVYISAEVAPISLLFDKDGQLLFLGGSYWWFGSAPMGIYRLDLQGSGEAEMLYPINNLVTPRRLVQMP